jgi:carbon-monoxide dehydrogenase small subunit
MQYVTLRVNGIDETDYIETSWTLCHVLRDVLDLTGTKEGCSNGDCGLCTVMLDGIPVKSCQMLAMRARGKDVVTIEGLQEPDGTLHPLQKAFVESFASQCGYCIPGIIMSAKSLLEDNPDPTEDEVRVGLTGNMCRCTGYTKIVEAILVAAEEMRAA